MNYSRAAYGSSNPNNNRPANGDRYAWGGYAWPQGVPAGLLGTTDYTTRQGQRLRVTARREIVPLLELAFKIMDRKHGYVIYAARGGEPWGPWGYANRPVAGTSTPSGHSMALSFDVNAPLNPYSSTFESDMPPAMVADLESIGFYWGGRYSGQRYDAMHFGYCYPPASVAGHVSRATAILASAGQVVVPAPAPVPTPTPAPRPTAPTFPLPAGHYFGPVTGPAASHSGDARYDKQPVRDGLARAQARLNHFAKAYGRWSVVAEDGLYGPATRAAITSFQALAGGLSIDGLLGAQSWARLFA